MDASRGKMPTASARRFTVSLKRSIVTATPIGCCRFGAGCACPAVEMRQKGRKDGRLFCRLEGGYSGSIEALDGGSGRGFRSEAARAEVAPQGMAPGARGADIGRPHAVSRWQVPDWRKTLMAGALVVEARPARPAASQNRADRIKVRVWDQRGIVLVHKRLEGATFV